MHGTPPTRPREALAPSEGGEWGHNDLIYLLRRWVRRALSFDDVPAFFVFGDPLKGAGSDNYSCHFWGEPTTPQIEPFGACSSVYGSGL